MEQTYRPPRRRGPRIAVIGGGHGLSNMLRGLKRYTENIAAIVTVADDGGGSGVLREDLGMPPPGDIRSCMEALADTESLMQRLLAYRFPEGVLAGQAFGNLLLAALDGISGSFDQAVARMSEVLAISGRILPVTNANVQLEASFENGRSIVSESGICDFKKEQDCRITRMRLLPEHPPALPEAIRVIEDAELIVLGPGSLYTSVIPNLLVDGISDAIRRSAALKIYVCNIMTQDGETEGLTASEHLAALMEHGGGPGLVDVCLCNDEPVREELLGRYLAENAVPISVDREAIEALGVEPVCKPLASDTQNYARHSYTKLANAITEVYRERAHTRIF